ncbi:histidine phosphatase family protein [Candidatus Woesearchaeota archaeon]|nr:histidine phosphatase family protein [Candidatus Woesearchaeota archaeon]
MYLLLARHGETDYNIQGRLQGQLPNPLNSTGERQVEEQAKELAKIPFDVIISSDLERSLQGARTHADLVGLGVTVDPQWRERNFGRHEGKLVTEIRSDQQDYNALVKHFYECNCPEGESLHQFQDRILDAIRQTHSQYNGKRVVVHTHGGVIMAAINILLGERLELTNAHPHKNGYVSYFHLKRRSDILAEADELADELVIADKLVNVPGREIASRLGKQH